MTDCAKAVAAHPRPVQRVGHPSHQDPGAAIVEAKRAITDLGFLRRRHQRAHPGTVPGRTRVRRITHGQHFAGFGHRVDAGGPEAHLLRDLAKDRQMNLGVFNDEKFVADVACPQTAFAVLGNEPLRPA